VLSSRCRRRAQAGKAAASAVIADLVPQMVTKAVQQFLGSLKIGYQPFRLAAMFRRGYIELASHLVESVATTSSPCLGELKLLEIVA